MGKNTSVSLGNHFEEFVSQKIKTGRFNSASEVIRAGLRLLEIEERKVESLRLAIEDGEKSGYDENYDPAQHLEELHEKYKK